MRIHALTVLAAGLLAGGAMAAERYDRRLDAAAAEIAAARMGPLRGGFAPDERPALVVPAAVPPQPPRAERPPAPGEWRGGLAIAVERKTDVSPEL